LSVVAARARPTTDGATPRSTAMTTDRLLVGTEVGAKRWPYSGAHPLAWGRPWKGVVIAHDDPRAWADTLAFPGRVPTIEEARAHVAEITARGFDKTLKIPVLWDYGAHGEKVYFEMAYSLRPYAEDVAEWEEARERCLDGYREKAPPT